MIATQPEVESNGRYSITDAATKLGVSRRTLHRYIDDKKIKVQYRKANRKPFVTGLEIIKVWNQTF